MTKSEKDTNAAEGDAKANNKKRSSAEEEEEEEHPDSKTLKRAKPSVSKAAEELMCPILQDLPIDPVTAEDGQIYEREEIEKYLEEKGNAAISPVTRKRFKNKGLFPSVHVRNTIEHLVESGIIEGDLAKTWKKRMREKKRNEKKVKNLEKRAKEGDANAMYSFALGYALGKYGLKRDGAEAFKWAKKSADMQNVHGMAFAGHCLVGGLGDEIDKNEREGLVLISLAAAQGSVCACILLGEMYYHGQYGVAKNSNNAKHWLEKALAGEDSERHIGRSALNDARDMLKEIDARGGADDVARGFESYEAEEYLSN